MEDNVPLAADARPPLGMVVLAVCAGILGFSLSFFSAVAAWVEFRPIDVLVFLTGPPVMLAGVAFYRLRNWAWFLGVITTSVLVTLSCSDAITYLIHPDGWNASDDWLAPFVWVGFPFLFYYLIRPRTRALFGIGSLGPKTVQNGAK